VFYLGTTAISESDVFSDTLVNEVYVNDSSYPVTSDTFCGKPVIRVTDYGTCGSELAWLLSNDNTLNVSGTGEMASYSTSADYPWHSYSVSVEKVVIGNSVTAIGSNAFSDFINLISVVIGESVTTIGSNAFNGCSELSSVYYLGSTAISTNDVFDGCTLLEKILVMDSYPTESAEFCGKQVQRLIDYGKCGDSLTWDLYDTYTLVISGEGEMYDYDDSLHLFVRHDGSSNTAPWYSYRELVNNIIIGESVTSIGSYAFEDCSKLASIIIPASITTIGSYAFNNCTNLINVMYYGKTDPGLSSQGIFEGCTNLTSISVTEDYEQDSFCGITGLILVIESSSKSIIESSSKSVIDSSSKSVIDSSSKSVIDSSSKSVIDSSSKSVIDSSSKSSIPLPSPSSESGKGGISGGVIAAIVIGVILIAGIVAVIIYFAVTHGRKQGKKHSGIPDEEDADAELESMSAI